MKTGALTAISTNTYTSATTSSTNKGNNICVCDNVMLETHFVFQILAAIDFNLNTGLVDVVLATNVEGSCSQPYFINFKNSVKFQTVDTV